MMAGRAAQREGRGCTREDFLCAIMEGTFPAAQWSGKPADLAENRPREQATATHCKNGLGHVLLPTRTASDWREGRAGSVPPQHAIHIERSSVVLPGCTAQDPFYGVHSFPKPRRQAAEPASVDEDLTGNSDLRCLLAGPRAG